MQAIRNIAILAHVDAGKTTLSERLLFTAGQIRRPGNVEDGLATMDYLPEEKERGITIESGVAHYEWKNIWFNFIDTPGHIDFGAEVDSALSAAESAVLVVAASSGVETQTASAWRKLREAHLKTFVFINKLDNPHHSLDETLLSIEESFGARPVLLSYPEFENGKIVSEIDVLSKTRLIHDASGREVPEKISPEAEPKFLKTLYDEALEFASTVNDELLEALLSDSSISQDVLKKALFELSHSKDYIFCYAGSAKENFSVRSLMTALAFFSTPPKALNREELGTVIRLRHFRGLGETAIFRSHSDRIKKLWPDHFNFFRMRANLLEPVEEIRAGDIYALQTKTPLELGNVLSLSGAPIRKALDFQGHYQPLLQTHIECEREEDFPILQESLKALSRMDPSIRTEYREELGCWIIHTVGEVQLEVIKERLFREYRIALRTGDPEVLYRELLKTPVESFQTTLQAGPFSITIEFSASAQKETALYFPDDSFETFSSSIDSQKEKSYREERTQPFFFEDSSCKNTLLCHNMKEEEARAVRDSLFDLVFSGVLGKGSLEKTNFTFQIKQKSPNAPIHLLKKIAEDAFKLSVRPQAISLQEPWMELFAECPIAYAGALTNDIQARKGKVRSVVGDGRIHSFYAEVPLKNLFGYATAIRSISRGTASYSARFLEYREVSTNR